MDLTQEFSKICRKNGWKNTPQRYRIYCAIHENFTHPSVDQIWEEVKREIPSMTRESVYRILNDFASRGIIMRLDDLNAARYDWQSNPHGHFICSECGKITDFPLPQNMEYPDLGGVDTTDLSHVELRLVGRCSECRKKALLQNEAEKKNKPITREK